MTKRNQQPEQQLQRSVCAFLRMALPKDAWFTAIPIGGGGRLRGAILKGMGTKSGTPDIMVIWQGQARFLELKSQRGTVSDAQLATMADIARAGGKCFVCRSIEDVSRALESWLIPSKVTISSSESDWAG